MWTNIGLKFWGLKERDIALHSVGKDFDVNSLIETATAESMLANADGPKVKQQARLTNQALAQVVEDKLKHEAVAQSGH